MTQNQALDILKTGANVFLTGEPGSGKTYTINSYVAYLRQHDIFPAITASTGIAATHIGGTTIHSWSGIGINNYLDKYTLDRIASNKSVYKRVSEAKVLIIDEVSMLSAPTLTAIDAVCREIKGNELAFGGLQVIFVGDFFQLPPIYKGEGLTPFAYESQAWAAAKLAVCYLSEQHRQSDNVFNNLLKSIRSNQFSEEQLPHLEKRLMGADANLSGIPRLFSHNMDVDRVNTDHLNNLADEPLMFTMTSKGRSALVDGLKKSCLSPENLQLKLNAAVMFTKNNPKEGYVNGTLGTVVGFDEHTHYPIVKTFDDQTITAVPADWSVVDGDRVLAQVTQVPLRLAWAITVHKSQGMTLDSAIVDLRQVFEYGQGYVALSRVRNLDGIHLLGWNERTFQVHPKVLEIDQVFRANSLNAEEAFGKMDKQELTKYHENFIRASGGSIEELESETKIPKGDTYEQTLLLWNQGKSIEEIISARDLTRQTILTHIEKLSRLDLIKDSELERILTDELRDAISLIHKAFDELGAEKLSPVFAKFSGQHSYGDIQIARIFYKK